MDNIIKKEQVFRLWNGSATLGKSASGYTLQYSADGKDWENSEP